MWTLPGAQLILQSQDSLHGTVEGKLACPSRWTPFVKGLVFPVVA